MNKRLIMILILISISALLFTMAPIPPPDPDPDPADCSPGYWKNHTDNWGEYYAPTDLYNGGPTTLLAALQGGRYTKVSRFEVAGWLNSDSTSIKCKD